MKCLISIFRCLMLRPIDVISRLTVFTLLRNYMYFFLAFSSNLCNGSDAFVHHLCIHRLPTLPHIRVHRLPLFDTYNSIQPLLFWFSSFFPLYIKFNDTTLYLASILTWDRNISIWIFIFFHDWCHSFITYYELIICPIFSNYFTHPSWHFFSLHSFYVPFSWPWVQYCDRYHISDPLMKSTFKSVYYILLFYKLNNFIKNKNQSDLIYINLKLKKNQEYTWINFSPQKNIYQ